MTGLLLAALLTQADAPLLVLAPDPVERPAMTLSAGETVPFNGVCMTDSLAVKTGKRIVSCETTLKEAEASFLIPKHVLILGLVGVFVAGFAAGAAVVVATTK